MVNFDRDKFEEMNTEQKIAFVNDLVDKNIKLTEEEITFLIPQNKKKYFYNRVKTSDWLDDYEFNSLTDREKEIYISNNRFLQKADLKRLPDNLQKKFVDKTISSGVQLTPEEFSLLADDDIREYYVNEKAKFAIDITFTSEELKYLDFEG
jgi:hypothetical protein